MLNPLNIKIIVDSIPQKGTWKRIKREKSANIKLEKSLGVEGKPKLSHSVDVINMDLEKKQKMDEDSKTLIEASEFGAAEVARQPRQEQ